MYSVWVKEIFYPTVLNAAITSIEGITLAEHDIQ